ncbi:MAG: YigZ family protein [Nautiliaceae bacterium]
MKTIKDLSAASLEVKKSKFHSFLVPYSLFEETLNDLKKRHPKANHFVTAFRYLNEHNQIVEGSSDDGEPRGSSGKPTLKVLEGNNLINVGIITVRYFGGILLGVGGLVKAYSDVANMAVKNADLIDYAPVFEYTFEVDYNKTREIEYFLKKYDVLVIDRAFGGEGIKYFIRDSIEKIEKIKEIL